MAFSSKVEYKEAPKPLPESVPYGPEYGDDTLTSKTITLKCYGLADKVFDRVPISIGNAPDQKYRIMDRSCDPSHASINFEDGKFVLINLSQKGLFLDGAQLSPSGRSSAYLNKTSRIEIGSTIIDVSIK
ncbi:MAG: FHA domain-containing protein [Clostridiales bacterium]|jgi:predicted component of type VI protein secretion system|nr:FHA domain-containing protein [Clostridiales bacterium]